MFIPNKLHFVYVIVFVVCWQLFSKKTLKKWKIYKIADFFCLDRQNFVFRSRRGSFSLQLSTPSNRAMSKARFIRRFAASIGLIDRFRFEILYLFFD